MSRTVQGISIGVAALLVVAGVGLWWVYGHLGQLVERAVETHGPGITGTEVALDGATISIFSGEGSLSDLTVRNPEGFSDDAAFELGTVATAIDVTTLTDDVVRVKSVVIDAPKLLAEFDGRGVSNLQTILNSVRAAGGKPAKKSADSGPPKKLIIEEFRLTNAEVRVLAPAFEVDKTLTLGPILLRDVGGRQGGAAAADIVNQILRPVVQNAVRSARKEFVSSKRDELKEKAKQKLLDKVFD